MFLGIIQPCHFPHSLAGLAITPHRNRLSDKTVEQPILIRSKYELFFRMQKYKSAH